MADIAKCHGNRCTMRETCWRFLAPAEERRQTWFQVEPVDRNGFCAHYLHTETETKRDE